jgi:hypothetical protein
MSGASSRRAVRRAPLARTLSAMVWALVPCAAGLAGCVPERALSSYREEAGEPATESTRTSVRGLPDAGTVDAGGAPEPFDAPLRDDAGPLAAPALDCRDECVCERGAFGALMFCQTPVSHEEAVELCALAGGSLVSVDDAERNGWLGTRMTALAADDFWLSGTDSEDEGVWRWRDGRVFFDAAADGGAPRPYAPWDEGQPNDLNGEDCMRSSGGVWRDLDCSETLAFVCEA